MSFLVPNLNSEPTLMSTVHNRVGNNHPNSYRRMRLIFGLVALGTIGLDCLPAIETSLTYDDSATFALVGVVGEFVANGACEVAFEIIFVHYICYKIGNVNILVPPIFRSYIEIVPSSKHRSLTYFGYFFMDFIELMDLRQNSYNSFKVSFARLKVYYIIILNCVVDMGKKIQKQPRLKLEHVEPTEPQAPRSRPQSKPLKLQQKPQPPTKREQPLQKDKKSEAPAQPAQPAQPQKKKKKIKHARLIIRNLVFDINEKHIKKLMAPYGEVKEVSIPKHPDRNTTRGFAFVQMANKNSCLKAIKELNGTQYKGRPIVLDMAVSKENFMTEKLKEAPKETVEQKNQEEEQIQNEQSGQKLKKQEAESQSNQHKQSEEQDEQEEQLSEGQKQEKQKQDHKLQIFIRNLPISTTEDELYKHFVKHGRIKFVRVCKNKETGVSKGTAFIKFYDAAVPQKLIHESRSYEMFLLKKLVNWTPDPNIKLEIDGIIMKIFPVQSRKQIQGKLKEREGQTKTEKKVKPVKKIKKLEDLVKIDTHDKRKLSLALLGRWKAHDNMNENDYQLLKSHQREKIQKLKNPNASVSDTRIILKHLDKTITEEDIRTICYKFLTQNNLNKSALTYCKLMLDRDMKKSAGFAFVQFKKHETAKQFLEMLVKQPQLVQNRLYIVEFAIQDSRKMLKLAKRNTQGKPGQKKDIKAKKQKQSRPPGRKQSKNRSQKPLKRKFIKK